MSLRPEFNSPALGDFSTPIPQGTAVIDFPFKAVGDDVTFTISQEFFQLAQKYVPSVFDVTPPTNLNYDNSLPLNGFVYKINVTAGGSGFTGAPAVTLGAPDVMGGVQATASATVSGIIASIAVDDGGSGYTSTPVVSFSGGGGSGAAATAVLTGVVTAITVINGGENFDSAPTVTIAAPDIAGGTQAVATASLDTGVTSIAVTGAGSGYTSPPAVSFSGGGGSGAAAIAIISGGAITAIQITNPGTGYSGAPDVAFDSGAATATATVTQYVVSIAVGTPGTGYSFPPAVALTGGGGDSANAVAATSFIVASVTVTNAGSGYTSAPTVVFTGGGGSGAAATASRTAGAVVALTSTNRGSGYTNNPSVSFSGGGGSDAAATALTTGPVLCVGDSTVAAEHTGLVHFVTTWAIKPISRVEPEDFSNAYPGLNQTAGYCVLSMNGAAARFIPPPGANVIAPSGYYDVTQGYVANFPVWIFTITSGLMPFSAGQGIDLTIGTLTGYFSVNTNIQTVGVNYFTINVGGATIGGTYGYPVAVSGAAVEIQPRTIVVSGTATFDYFDTADETTITRVAPLIIKDVNGNQVQNVSPITNPNYATYVGWINAKLSFVAQYSQISRWRGNLWQRKTISIPAI